MRKLLASISVAALALAQPAAAQQPSTVSNLPYASTPLSGAELLYIIQGGISKKTPANTINGGGGGGGLVVNAQTGTSYTVAVSDSNKLVTFNNASPVAVTLPAATGAFKSPFCWSPQNIGAGAVTITPAGSTINGAATFALTTNQGVIVCSDGANWQIGYGNGGGGGGLLINAQTGTTYTVLASDSNKLVTFNNASPVAVTLPQATGAFKPPFCWSPQDLGGGTVTITPTTSTINGGATLPLTTSQGVIVCSDGANWQIGYSGLGSASSNPVLVSYVPTDNTGLASCVPTAIAGSKVGNLYFGGVFTAATCFNNPIIFSGLTSVPNLYGCTFTDMTAPANTVTQSAFTTTSVTALATTTVGDQVSYKCFGS